MSARTVLRKRLMVNDRIKDADGNLTEDPVHRAVIERNRLLNAGKIDKRDFENPINLAIRRSANLAPHLVDDGLDKPADAPNTSEPDYPRLAPEAQEMLPQADDPVEAQEAGIVSQNVNFLTTWGLVLREDPSAPGQVNPDTGEIEYDWLPGWSPDEIRPALLEPMDVLTEIADDGGFGDLPTQDMFSDLEKRSVAVDIVLNPAQHSNAGQYWGTGKSTAPTFGTARDAMRLIGANWVGTFPEESENRLGENINVVIVDTGLNERYLRSLVPNLNFAGGFINRVLRQPDPGEFQSPIKAMHSGHGNMIARNILRIAPHVRLFDAPVLPPRVTDVGHFTHTVEMLYEAIEELTAVCPYAQDPWIIVNAWAVADNIQECGMGPANMLYATGEHHNTNALIQNMADDFAIIFAAGNNGLFEPDPFAGIYNRGPHSPNGNPSFEGGRPFGSLVGANALPGVLTVGACTVNGVWIGSSSQGDGPEALRRIHNAPPSGKPDVVAPSWFAENNDSHQMSTGTSASCAVAAGLAASAWGTDPTQLPQELLEAMRVAAADQALANGAAPQYLKRFGNGVVRSTV